MSEEINDPGTGKSFGKHHNRLINSDGSFNVTRKGARTGFRDIFSLLVETSWLKFFGILFIGYLLFNLIFAGIFWLIGADQITGINPNQNTFLQLFFFSIQTFTTVGYGAISPTGVGAQALSTIVAFVGFLSFSLATGLLYGRFSRPNPKLVFSKNILYSKYQDAYSLKLRFANERQSVLLELEASLMLTIDVVDSEGNVGKNYFRLPLEVSKIQMMPLSWTLVHKIDKESPLWEKSRDEILSQNPEIIVNLKGFDEVYGQHVRIRHSYTAKDFLWNKNFTKIFYAADDGTIAIDLDDINRMENDPD